MLPKELLAAVRRLEIKTKRLANDLLSGQYQSTFRGRGVAFDELREYQYGDDIRAIDWNVSARYQTPYIKRFVEERELTVMLLVDVSASLAFGSQRRQKRELAAEITALLSFAAVNNGDRAGLLSFTDRVEQYLPPRRSKNHVLSLLTKLLLSQTEAVSTNPAAAFDFFLQVQKRRTVVFLLSDFWGVEKLPSMKLLAQKHDLVPIVITDPWEESLPHAGLIPMQDPERRSTFLIDTSDRNVRRAYEENYRQAETKRRELFVGLGVSPIRVRTDQPYFSEILSFFQQRGAK